MYGPCIVPTGPCLATCSLVRLPPLQSTRHRQGTSHLEFGTCVDWAVATHLLLPSVVCPNRITRNTLESVYATTSSLGPPRMIPVIVSGHSADPPSLQEARV